MDHEDSSDAESDFQEPSSSYISPRKRGIEQITVSSSTSSTNSADESSSDSNEYFHDREELFQIPICDDDLLEINDETYYVRELASAEDVKNSCNEFATDMVNKHWTAIRHHFDSFFAVVRWNAPDDITWEDRANVLELMQYGLDAIVPVIKRHVETLCNAEVTTEAMANESKRLRNYMLMYVYLATKVAGLIDAEATKRMKNAAMTAGKGKKKNAEDISRDPIVKSWQETRASIIKDLYNLCMMTIVDNKGMIRHRALAKIFQGGVYEQQFITTYTNFAVRLLEGYEVCKAVGRSWAFSVFYLIRGVCMGFDRFGQMGNAIMEAIKRIDAFQSGNTLTSFPFVEAILAVSGKSQDMDQLFLVMLNYFGRMDPDEFKESSSKPYSLLITTLAEKHPSLLSRNIHGLTNFLNQDPATLRSAVLQAYVDMVFFLHEEVKTEKDERKQEILMHRREQMLQRLQCHICDDSAHVRAKVLNLWSKLAIKRQIPVSFIQGSLISTIGSRLTDKSVMVRKAAAHALSTFLQYNCFGPNLSAPVIQSHVEALKKERKELKFENPESSGVHAAMESFEAMKSEIEGYIEASLKTLLAPKSRESSPEGDVGEEVIEIDDEDSEASDASLRPKRVSVDGTGTAMSGPELTKGLMNMILDENQRPAACDMFTKVHINNDPKKKEYTEEDVKELIPSVLEGLQAEYLNAVVAEQLLDDNLQLEEEDRMRDYQVKVEKISKKIENGKNCLMFAYEIQRCLPAAVRGIFTGQITEITESLNFISECRKFEIRESSAAVKDVLNLIWRKDTSVRDVVVKAGMDMFHSQNQDVAVQNLRTARNLMEIFLENEDSEMESIEETVYEMLTAAHVFGDYTVKVFCVLACLGNDRVRWSALRLLSVVTRTHTQYSRDLLPFFIRCFESTEEPKTKELCLTAFANMKCRDTGAKKHFMPIPFRIPAADRNIQVIVVDLMHFFDESTEERWMQRMRQTVDIAFHICSETTTTCAYMFDYCFSLTKKALDKLVAVQKEVLRLREMQEDPMKFVDLEEMRREAQEAKEKAAEEEEDMFGEEAETSVDAEEEPSREEAEPKIDPKVEKWISLKLKKMMEIHGTCKTKWKTCVIRLFWMVSEMALQLIVHSEETFLAQMKMYNDLVADLREQSKSVADAEVVNTPYDELTRWEIHLREKKGLFEPGDIEDDRLGVSAISVEDKLQQRILFNMESRLFSNEYSIIRCTVVLVIYAVDRRRHIDPEIVDAAVFALGKIMLTSENISKAYLQMFLDCLPTVTAGCRNNMVLVLADLCYRFPNVIELNSEALFSLSEDSDDGVRETAMLVLSHLILNDQLKTRGTVAGLTPRIFDRHHNIAKIARNFFTELAQKSNILYNFLPDIISRLTVRIDRHHVKLFENVMEFLLKFIIKERQVDALIEKVCQRFIHASTGKRDGVILAECLAFCLAQLPMTGKSICIMNDNMGYIKPFLKDDRVFANFEKLLQSYRKMAKNGEAKETIDEFEETIIKHAT
ncbi:hypothetical protein L596_020132 [Steinernema carpocapsae]|uniref:Uncharacterized protein n=1 Tax=Steinernema carpocapsae TaxID=34508 RepID=A0A4V6A0T5_STECR|nr:hypothetical protein L596_020132 [Steinernema carpocapsae]